jgi:GT2 family glycosyltransferase
MKIVVVIATCGRQRLLERTLASLTQCRIPEGFEGTIVVENGSSSGADQVVRQAASALKPRYLFEPKGNKSRALNVALRDAGDALIVFLDDDVRASVALLESYAAAASAAGRGHFFGGPVAPEYEETPPAWLLKFLPISARGYDSLPTTWNWFLGFNWAAYSDDLKRVGGFDERLGPGGISGGIGDETELQMRLRAVGLNARYVPGALVHHWIPRDRCSPEWVLRRRYSYGVLTALMTNTPLALFRAAAAGCVRALFQGVDRDSIARFAARHELRRNVGIIRGILLRRRYRGGAPPGLQSNG